MKKPFVSYKKLAAFTLGATSLIFAVSSARADLTFLGVASGDASTNEAVLWTRAVDSAAPAAANLTALVAANDPTVTISVQSFAAVTVPTNDYTAKVIASNLMPGTRYYYRFANAANPANQSIIGTFKTAPALNASAPLHFAFSGDADGLIRPYNLASVFPTLGLDFFVWDGDTIYETASAGSPAVAVSGQIPAPSNVGASSTQLYTDYTRKYREQFIPVNLGGQACLQPMFASQGNYTTYDNHELGNRQYINGGAPAGGAVADMANGAGVDARVSSFDTNNSPFSTNYMNKAMGFQILQRVYMSYQPLKERGIINTGVDPRTDGTPQLFFAQRWGQNAIFINVDDRTYRDIRIKTAANADDTGPRAGNPNRTMIGATQFAWLKQALLDAENAGVAWKFVLISDPIDQIGPIGGALNNVTNGGNTGYAAVSSDGGKSWVGGYRAERNALLKFIADNHIYNVVFMATDDHQNRINELTYSPTGLTEDETTYTEVPHCFSIVDGPLGATGPDLVTNHTFANNKLIADSIAAAEAAAGVDPIGLNPNYPGLHNVLRENDPLADSVRQPVDFYSPDTFNFNTLDVTANGGMLTVTSVGINSYKTDSRPEYDPVNNPAREIFQFQVDAFAFPTISCPSDLVVSNDPGQCSALVSFSAAVTGRPAPTVTYTLNGSAITSPYVFPKGTNVVTSTASNVTGVATCSFKVVVQDRETPVVGCQAGSNPSGKNVPKGNAGFTQLLAQDNCDPAPKIYVRDSASAFVAGPFASGDMVKFTVAKGAAPFTEPMGGGVTHIVLKGAPLLYATDADGNVSAPQAGCQ
jgi:phosphodiesterase/alkaline phosphatase D-like protein